MRKDEEELLIDALATGDPGGAIERQEARGQREMIRSDVLPIQCLTPGGWEALESLGVQRGEMADDLFVKVTLPDGWTKSGLSGSLYSVLRDGRGRERVVIFYKAASYDREAYFTISSRFMVRYEDLPVDSVGVRARMVAYDGDQVIFRPPVVDTKSRNESDIAERALCQQWLDERYPDWRSLTAYWDDAGEESTPEG